MSKQNFEIPNVITECGDYREELYIAKDLILKSKKFIVPSPIRHEMLETIHEGHQYVERCKKKAERNICWPRIMARIDDMVPKCSVRLERRNTNVRGPLRPHSNPDGKQLGHTCFLFNL